MYEWLERAVAVKSNPIYLTAVSEEFVPYRRRSSLSQDFWRRLDLCTSRAQLSGRRDVLVEAEEIVGVVLLLEGGEARVVGAVRSLDR